MVWDAGPADLLCGLLFALALRGVARPGGGRGGNRWGMAGMALAIGTTLYTHNVASLPEILIALAVGGAVGLFVGHRVAVTAVPHLVAGFQGVIGLAVMGVAAGVSLDPESFGLVDIGSGEIVACGRIALGLGVAMGGVIVAGSVMAFIKLHGLLSAPLPISPAVRYGAALCILAAILGLIGVSLTLPAPEGVRWLGGSMIGLSLILGLLIVIPLGRADMPIMVSMMTGCSGWAAVVLGVMLHNIMMVAPGALVGSAGMTLAYAMSRARGTDSEGPA